MALQIPLHRKIELMSQKSSSSYTNKAYKYPPLLRIALFQMLSFHPPKPVFKHTPINILNKISINDTREDLPQRIKLF